MNRNAMLDKEARLRAAYEIMCDNDPADARPDVEDPPVNDEQEIIYDEWAARLADEDPA